MKTKSYQYTLVNPKKLLGPHLNLKVSPIEPKKTKNDLKTKRNKQIRKPKFSKMKVNPKTLLRPHPDPEIAQKGPKLPPKSKKKNKKADIKKCQIDL